MQLKVGMARFDITTQALVTGFLSRIPDSFNQRGTAAVVSRSARLTR